MSPAQGSTWPGLLLAGLLLATPAPAADAPGRLLVIGATARSAGEIIPRALDAGWTVVGLARRPEAVTLEHPRLSVVGGDVYDQASLEAAMTGEEVVVSMVGPRLDPMDMREVPAGFDLFSTGTANIVAAMKRRGNRRLLVASSLGVEEDFPVAAPGPDAGLRSRWLWSTRHLYGDMADMERLVADSGLDYVILRPPFLVEEPVRGDLRVTVDAPSPKGRMASYADFAVFVLEQAHGDRYLGRTVGLYTDRELRFGENADFEALARESREKAGVTGSIDAEDRP